MLGGAVFALHAEHRISFCFSAEQTRGHTLERAGGAACQFAFPDRGLWAIIRVCPAHLVSAGFG